MLSLCFNHEICPANYHYPGRDHETLFELSKCSSYPRSSLLSFTIHAVDHSYEYMNRQSACSYRRNLLHISVTNWPLAKPCFTNRDNILLRATKPCNMLVCWFSSVLKVSFHSRSQGWQASQQVGVATSGEFLPLRCWGFHSGRNCLHCKPPLLRR